MSLFLHSCVRLVPVARGTRQRRIKRLGLAWESAVKQLAVPGGSPQDSNKSVARVRTLGASGSSWLCIDVKRHARGVVSTFMYALSQPSNTSLLRL